MTDMFEDKMFITLIQLTRLVKLTTINRALQLL